VHLGHYDDEINAARVYDRAAIIKAAHDVGTKLNLNFKIEDYNEELLILCRIPQEHIATMLEKRDSQHG
jgi:hypothetical protein